MAGLAICTARRPCRAKTNSEAGGPHSGLDPQKTAGRIQPLEHRKLAQQLRVSHMMVARVWKRASLRPHRLERYMASNDPEFEAKAADVIGLYVHPPQHAAVFCVDEKSAIQLWTAWIRSCRFRPVGPNVTALSITAMAPYRCMPPSTLGPARCWGENRRPAHQPRVCGLLEPTWWPVNRPSARSM